MKHDLKKNLLSFSEVLKIVDEWIESTNWKKQLEAEHNFRSNLSKMYRLQQGFIVNCLSYLIIRKLSEILTDYRQSLVVDLNNKLKKEYQLLLYKQYFRRNNIFELFIVFLIKLTTVFLQGHFSNVRTDLEFQSNLCVILYHTFLGIQVNLKTYQILMNKMIFQSKVIKISKESSITSHKSVKNAQASSQSLFSSNYKSSLKLSLYDKPEREANYLRQSRMSFCRPIRQAMKRQTPFEDINFILKENLHVNPLPPLKKKKIDLQQLERQQTQPTLKQSNYQQLSNEKTNKKSKYIYSNQLSPSLKAYHPENLIFELNSRKVKMNQTLQCQKRQKNFEFIKNYKQSNQTNLNSGSNELKMSNNKQNCDWMTIVGDLKKKVINMRCKTDSNQNIKEKRFLREESYLKYDEQISQIEQKKSDLEIQKPLQTKQSSSSSSVDEQYFDQNPIDLDRPIFKLEKQKNSFQIESFQNESEKDFNQLINKHRTQRKGRNLASSIIRLDQDLFFSLCKSRKSSIFGTKKIKLHDEWILNQYKD